jgi:hypothetical protein
VPKISGMSKFFSDYRRNDVVAQNVPGRFPSLVTVKRAFRGSDLAETALGPVRRFHDHNVAILSGAETRFERVKQPHSQLPHFNLFDKHAMLQE